MRNFSGPPAVEFSAHSPLLHGEPGESHEDRAAGRRADRDISAGYDGLESTGPPCPSKERRDKDGAPAEFGVFLFQRTVIDWEMIVFRNLMLTWSVNSPAWSGVNSKS